ncbi:MAG: hypothetical protein PF569_08020 [Candidatus Woesearchaeota archaeon]|jgi:hypothetical protein|nr:hypothetical protein [Candidatus Woesearchaeota archaeon]
MFGSNSPVNPFAENRNVIEERIPVKKTVPKSVSRAIDRVKKTPEVRKEEVIIPSIPPKIETPYVPKYTSLERFEGLTPIKFSQERKPVSFRIIRGYIDEDLEKDYTNLKLKLSDLRVVEKHEDFPKGDYFMHMASLYHKFKLFDIFEFVDERGNLKVTKEELIRHLHKLDL